MPRPRHDGLAICGIAAEAEPCRRGGTPGEAAILQFTVFVLLVATAAIVSWCARRVSVPLAFAVFFAVDGAYQSFRYPPGAAHASLSALAAIAFCAVAWAVDRVSPES